MHKAIHLVSAAMSGMFAALGINAAPHAMPNKNAFTGGIGRTRTPGPKRPAGSKALRKMEEARFGRAVLR